jgi:FixJ family two-component response regulator
MKPTRPLIAVLDDEEPVRKALERLLRSTGMAVETFASGSLFLASLSRAVWDCLILDLHMPEANGFDVQEWLAASGTNLPVVVITGHHSREARARVLAAGAIAYLQKPVDEQALLEAIALALSPREPT